MKSPSQLQEEINAIAAQIRETSDSQTIKSLEKKKRALEIERDLKKVMVFGFHAHS